MASTIESGNAQNVANFEDLISFCKANSSIYNPSREALQIIYLETILSNSRSALEGVRTAKTNYSNATNAREIAFKPLKQLSTRVINALAASGASIQTLADAKTSNNKIQGKRAKAVEQPDAKAIAEGAAPVRTASVSQQSYDKMVDHFAQLIITVGAEPKYAPNENDLKITSLNTILADLRIKNTAVIEATTALSNARIARDMILYSEGSGMLSIVKEVKLYVKSIFGATGAQYKQLSALRFTKRVID